MSCDSNDQYMYKFMKAHGVFSYTSLMMCRRISNVTFTNGFMRSLIVISADSNQVFCFARLFNIDLISKASSIGGTTSGQYHLVET